MKLKLMTIGIASVIALAGCQGNVNDEGRGVDDSNIEPTRYNDQQQNTNQNRVIPDNTRNRDDMRGQDDRRGDRDNIGDNDSKYEVADEAAEKITSKVKEVDNAYVLTTNNNAYVAVMMDQDNQRNTDNRNTDNNRDRKGKADNEVHDERNMTNSKRDGQDDVSDDLKEKISDVVQDVDNNIDNVYVSSNPDFIDLTNSYINDVNAGEPIRGLFDQMGNMIERLFPQDRR